jgi:hypothetical protein
MIFFLSFINASVKAMLQYKPFRDGVLAIETQDNVVTRLQQLCNAIHSGKSSVVAPTEFYNAIKSAQPNFGGQLPIAITVPYAC